MAKIESFSVFANETATSLSPAEIERELSSMWKPINEAQGSSVSRVVLGNVIWVGVSQRLEQVKKIFRALVPKFPARLFLVEYQAENTEETINAMVSAQCFVPQPGAVPVCCEVIHLQFGPNSARHVRGVVAPLLLPDIQTVLWTGLGSAEFPQLRDLQQHVDRTIRRASLAEDPAGFLLSMLNDSHPTFDLSWFRITPIREQIMAFFDDPANSLNLGEIQTVSIVLHRTSEQKLSLLIMAMLVGWMGSRLKWEIIETQAADLNKNAYAFASASGPVEVRIQPSDASKEDLLATLKITDRSGANFEVVVGSGRIDLNCGDRTNHQSPERHSVHGELEESEALGLALNSPARARYFRQAAMLAVPLIRAFGTTTS